MNPDVIPLGLEMMRILAVLFFFLATGCNESRRIDTTVPSEIKPLSEFESDQGDKIYSCHGPDSPWGDYGEMLFHGMTGRLGRTSDPDGEFQLERAGPAIPPITMPAEGVLVTDRMKTVMQTAGFAGVDFRPVELTRIVEIDWETWNVEASDPKFYPEGGTPAFYILNLPHSPAAAKEMGTIWELVLSVNACVHRVEAENEVQFEYAPDSWQGNDIFVAEGNGYTYVSPRAKSWFNEYFPNWTTFREIRQHSAAAE